ncbi:MAG: hypothetical protein QW607_11050 [Desulfurococcaceae archaeon]
MKPNELFNPLFGNTFKVGKDVEYLGNFYVETAKRIAFKTFFEKMVENDKQILEEVEKRMYHYAMGIDVYTVEPRYENYYIHRDFFPDFVNILNSYISKLESDRSVYDRVVDSLYETNNDVYSYIKMLKDKGIDLYPVYVKMLKNMVNDLKTRGEKLFMSIDYEKLKDMFIKLKEQLKSKKRYDTETLDMFIEFLRESRIYDVANFLAKYVFSVIPMQRGEKWYKNSESWFTKILANEFVNKLRKSGIEINTDALNLFSLRLITSIWEDEKSYFGDEERYEKFRKVYEYQSLSSSVVRSFLNPETWKYFHPKFLKQFKSFDDFIENSGIKKDSEYFTPFFIIGMEYAYENKLLPETREMDRMEFHDYLSELIPVQKNHIKNYVGEQNVHLYRLLPESVDKKKGVAYYKKDNLVKYFGVSNINSCVRHRLLVHIEKDLIGVSRDVSFILMSDESGKTIGRFIDVGDFIINLYYNNMAYETAFGEGGKDVVSNYLENIKKVYDDFDLLYQNITHYRPIGVEKIEKKILNKMKDMKKIFHVNDFIKVWRY